MKGKKLKIFYIILATALVLGAVIVGVVLFGAGTSGDDAVARPTPTPTGTAGDDATAQPIPTPAATAGATPSPSPGPSETPDAGETSAAPSSPATSASPEAPDDTYVIENTRFGIDSTGGNARATTDGINAALKWAKDQGYSTVEFEEGTYMVQCRWEDRFSAPTDGILVPSDLTLDLGNSTFVMEPNSNPEYVIFGIVNQSNVTIKNGTLLGDLEGHIYAPSENSPTHEYGFGICISASCNVLIQDVTISGMTGDGVILEGSYSCIADGGSMSSQIRILGCAISRCRRQGISVVGACDIEIAQNEIYAISGTAPQYGILVMAGLDYVIDQVVIHDNVIYDCAGGAIACNTGSHCEVYANTCGGNILVVYAAGVGIYGNTIQNSYIEVMPDASDVTVENNVLEGDSWIKFDQSLPESSDSNL